MDVKGISADTTSSEENFEKPRATKKGRNKKRYKKNEEGTFRVPDVTLRTYINIYRRFSRADSNQGNCTDFVCAARVGSSSSPRTFYETTLYHFELSLVIS